MTKVSSLVTYFILFAMACVFGVVALSVLGSSSSITYYASSKWTYGGLNGYHDTFPVGFENYTLSEHALNGHKNELLNAETIYQYLLTGQCLAHRVFCRHSDGMEIYLCKHGGHVGILRVFEGEISTGYRRDTWRDDGITEDWRLCK